MNLVALAAVVLAAAAAAQVGATAVEACPRGLLPLAGTNPIAAATTAALRQMQPADRPQVTGALFAIADQQRGPQAKAQCGATAWRRTIVVYITARAYLPALSASQRVFFVGRFSTGYRVWEVVH